MGLTTAMTIIATVAAGAVALFGWISCHFCGPDFHPNRDKRDPFDYCQECWTLLKEDEIYGYLCSSCRIGLLTRAISPLPREPIGEMVISYDVETDGNMIRRQYWCSEIHISYASPCGHEVCRAARWRKS